MVIVVVLLAIAIFFISVILSWVYEPPIDPPVAVVKRRFGRIAWVRVQKGWIVVLPWIEIVETFPVDRITITVAPDEVITPDNVGLEVSITLYGSPDPDNLEAYWKSGKKEGINKILTSIAEQEIRQWARDPNSPPYTWEEAQSSQNGLVKKLHDDLIKEGGGEPEDPRNALKNYGFLLDKVTIGPIKLKGEAAKAKELEAKEVLERRAEVAETETELQIAKTVADGLRISRERAFKLMQDYKMIRAGHGNVYKLNFGDTAEVIDFGKKLLGAIGGAA